MRASATSMTLALKFSTAQRRRRRAAAWKIRFAPRTSFYTFFWSSLLKESRFRILAFQGQVSRLYILYLFCTGPLRSNRLSRRAWHPARTWPLLHLHRPFSFRIINGTMILQKLIQLNILGHFDLTLIILDPLRLLYKEPSYLFIFRNFNLMRQRAHTLRSHRIIPLLHRSKFRTIKHISKHSGLGLHLFSVYLICIQFTRSYCFRLYVLY